MDQQTIQNVIGQVGFPIACSLYLVYTLNKTTDAYHANVEKLRTTIENNTVVMTKILTRIGLDEQGNKIDK